MAEEKLSPQEIWIVENAGAIDEMVQSAGWKAFSQKVVEDITDQMNVVFMPNTRIDQETLAYSRGYVTALKNMIAYAQGINEAAREIEAKDEKRVQRRQTGVKLAGK